MTFGKYKKPLIMYSILLILISSLVMILGSGENVGPNWIRFSPTNNAAHDVLYMFIMVTLSAIIGGVLVGYALGPLYLWAHKKIIGRKMIYGIQDKPKPDKFKGYFIRGLFPALMAINFALMFAFSAIIQRIAITQFQDDLAPMLTLSALLALMVGISMGIFSSVWFLIDSGIVYSNKEKVRDRTHPVEVRSVGGWYNYLLKGYAGISVLISFYAFFWYIYEVMGFSAGVQGMAIMFIVFYPTMPLIITVLCFPALILLDLTHNHRKKYMLKIAAKFEISESLANPLDIR